MIDILAKLSVNNDIVTMFGKINLKEKKIELNCHLSDFPSAIINNRAMFYSLISTATFTDTESKHYTAYGVAFYKSQMSLLNNGVLTIIGSYKRLIRELEPDQKYICACFSFDCIEQLFHYDKFETERSQEKLTISKSETSHIEQQLSGVLSCNVDSILHGVISSTHMYHINLKQDKRISLHSKKMLSMDEWIEIIKKMKHYFEFVLNQEIRIRDVSFLCDISRPDKTSVMIDDELLSAKTFVKAIDENSYHGTEHELLEGLMGWMSNYDKFSRVVTIWLKTIYNLNISDEDRFIWEAQAFEAFCEINESINTKANKLKAKNQAFPNLKNYLYAVQEEYGFDSMYEPYYKDVKDVRNCYTHNNPDLKVLERQEKNSYKLIHYFFRRCIAKEFGIKKIKSLFFLIPPEVESTS